MYGYAWKQLLLESETDLTTIIHLLYSATFASTDIGVRIKEKSSEKSRRTP